MSDEYKRIIINSRTRPGLGITTNTFMCAVNNNEITVEEIIKWAHQNGFSWIELRDPEIKMSENELLDIKKLTEKLDMKVHYAWDATDLLNPDDEEFFKGVANARLFGPDTHCRVVIAPDHIKNVAGKKGYTKEEYEKIRTMVEKYTLYGKEQSVEICFENAFEPVEGDRLTFFGIGDLLDGCKIMKTTFDAGNFTNKMQSRVIPDKEEIIRYFRKYYKQIPYYHLKITKKNILSDVLEDGSDFSINQLFQEFEINPEMHICLELPAQDGVNTVKDNIVKSIGFLLEQKLAFLK